MSKDIICVNSVHWCAGRVEFCIISYSSIGVYPPSATALPSSSGHKIV